MARKRLTWDGSRVTTLNRRRNPISCIVTKQIGVGDYKNVIVFDPLLTGHVIRRMRSGRVRILMVTKGKHYNS